MYVYNVVTMPCRTFVLLVIVNHSWYSIVQIRKIKFILWVGKGFVFVWAGLN